MQRRDSLGLGRKYREAFRRKLIGNASLGRRDHQRLSGLLAEGSRVTGKGLHIITGPGDGNADQERVGRGVFRDDGQDVTEQPAIG